jgi:hypothetical protein
MPKFEDIAVPGVSVPLPPRHLVQDVSAGSIWAKESVKKSKKGIAKL